ncbi:carboxymuconolactone decarboxylase family protein [Solirubrobacter phytolaccae]|uniref:Carboxymuconolactone decarboxylase family protein n=1 Tax=Solirubrobacter phytolaccae TaxID=1404360 RepID=A0A9X3NG34_9ACTN|nr:carboxymuconolactone decarboxylase family protein [Solirubrobacter phytolaccae]MDA0183416.1 carboxymuconolactone decarboxylase family protein [Solirubrobacter phytolaccae]
MSRDRARRTLPGMFTVHTATSAPAGSRDALAALERNVGFIPNLAGVIAGSPVALNGFVGMQSALRGSRLTALEREVVGLTVSRVNDCAYSLAAHSRFAAAAGASEGLLAAVRDGASLEDERLERLRAFTEDVLAERGHVAAAFDAEETLEVLTQIAYTTLANFAADVSGAPVDDAFRALV